MDVQFAAACRRYSELRDKAGIFTSQIRSSLRASPVLTSPGESSLAHSPRPAETNPILLSAGKLAAAEGVRWQSSLG